MQKLLGIPVVVVKSVCCLYTKEAVNKTQIERGESLALDENPEFVFGILS